MDPSKHLPPSPTELIDWLNAEGLLDLEWDFPEDGDLFAAGLNVTTVQQAVVMAIEDHYGIELELADLAHEHLATPVSLVALITAKIA